MIMIPFHIWPLANSKIDQMNISEAIINLIFLLNIAKFIYELQIYTF
jgi:hypothetical protein